MLDAARELGVYVMGSSPIMQGKLASALPGDAVRSRQLHTMAQHALQFVRSTPGIGTVLAGMKRIEHVEENCAVLRV
jgi:predicted aldo/keto reductase-like oxidoreductase